MLRATMRVHAPRRSRKSTMTAHSLFSLKGKTALVTGASYGLGVTFAETLAEAGANVVLAARSLDKLTAFAGRLTAAGHKALAVKCDVGIAQDVGVDGRDRVGAFRSNRHPRQQRRYRGRLGDDARAAAARRLRADDARELDGNVVTAAAKSQHANSPMARADRSSTSRRLQASPVSPIFHRRISRRRRP